jgi:uncharacterized protein YecE (DUF72 family)
VAVWIARRAELRAEVFRRFLAALEPLRATGKLGGILMQMAPYVVPKEFSYDYLAWAREQLEGYEMLVEFRHKAWFEQAEQTLRFCEAQGMTYVIVDAPVFPLVIARTSPTVYARFHGRNAATRHKRTGSTAERFNYLYTREELQEWAGTMRELDAEAETVYAMFNNNGRSSATEVPKHLRGEAERREIAQAPTNALMLKEVLIA